MRQNESSTTNPFTWHSVLVLGIFVFLMVLGSHVSEQVTSAAHDYVNVADRTDSVADQNSQLDGMVGSALRAQHKDMLNPFPDFSSQTVVERKRSFVNFVLPYVEHQNEKIIQLRKRLAALLLSDQISAEEMDWLHSVADRFGLQIASDPSDLVEQLLPMVDYLPPSLVLAQAAIESGWGTSRFARKANNIFGQWCMSPGCGLIPQQRPEHAVYEVKKFSSVGQAVEKYFMNLNTNPAYRGLREIRSCHRSMGESLSGPVMAGGLLAYSGRGTDYIESVRSMIYSNEWHEMDGFDGDASDCGGFRDTVDTQVETETVLALVEGYEAPSGSAD